MQNASRRDLMRWTIPATLAGTGLLSWDSFAAAQPAMDEYHLPTNFYANGEYVLPKLPYAYDALEPHIDAQTMELHHGKHHAGYVRNLNAAIKMMADLDLASADARVVEGLQRDISFNFGGHALHSVFWGCMSPNPADAPTGSFAEAIHQTFGSFDRFKTYFGKIAGGVKGSGWAVLAFSPVGRQLVTYAIKDQDQQLGAGSVPLLAIDVWEHAYYLKYQNRRADYIAAWMKTVDWAGVSKMYSAFVGR